MLISHHKCQASHEQEGNESVESKDKGIAIMVHSMGQLHTEHGGGENFIPNDL